MSHIKITEENLQVFLGGMTTAFADQIKIMAGGTDPMISSEQWAYLLATFSNAMLRAQNSFNKKEGRHESIEIIEGLFLTAFAESRVEGVSEG